MRVMDQFIALDSEAGDRKLLVNIVDQVRKAGEALDEGNSTKAARILGKLDAELCHIVREFPEYKNGS